MGGVLLVSLLLLTAFVAVGCSSNDDDDNDEPTKYSVTIASDIEHGSVTATPTSAAAGATIALTATPDDNYELDAYAVTDAAGASVSVTSGGTFTMPESNVTVSATFKVASATTYAVTIASTIENGTVAASTTTAAAGATVTLTVTPSDGYQLETLTVTAGETAVTTTQDTSDTSKYTFTMPASAVMVSAAFTTTSSGGGSGSSDTVALTTPLTLEAIAAGTISVTNPWSTLKYTKNGGTLTAYSEDISLAAGDIVCFYAESSESTFSAYMQISCTADCYVYGNIMSLVTLEAGATSASQWNPDASSLTTTYAFMGLFEANTYIKNHASKTLTLPATTLAEGCYYSMFADCTGLTAAPALPATTLASRCYMYMFYGCTGLTSAPALPATTLAAHCYVNMFRDCTSLTTAPALPATTLASRCYVYMFRDCTSLTTAPALPATTLAENCYFAMFDGCTGLTSAPVLPATTLAEHCYNGMFQGCTSLTTAPDLPATTLANYCYYGMFQDCTSLEYIKCLATDISADYCTDRWVEGVAASGIFVKAASMTGWTSDTDGIPSGWTVQDATSGSSGTTIDLSNIPASALDGTTLIVANGTTLTGTLSQDYKIQIADGATVTLDGVTIEYIYGNFAGITCPGDATIILKDGSENAVCGAEDDDECYWPGIWIAPEKTLIIKGNGQLSAMSSSSFSFAAGIGAGDNHPCGNIEIQGGVITAEGSDGYAGIGGGIINECGTITISGGVITAVGGSRAAGIGSGEGGSCGNITISGGTITATGGNKAAGIGSGSEGVANSTTVAASCGTITITAGVTSVTATKGGSDAPNSIGAGYHSTCGTVTIGGVEGVVETSPYTYQPGAN
ncbi:MAG: hypothetical protein K6G80_09070 [Treponema sp.]|nr:hypothetical protein [Treponema sp.]